MTYAGTNRGGTAAILAAETLVRERAEAGTTPPVGIDQTIERFHNSIDQLMGEGGLWDAETAAAAFLQAGGDTAEAVHLLRAHRSALPRFAMSEPVELGEMTILRRVVPAQRDPDGPQLLGETVDYTARLLQRPGDPAPLPFEEDSVAPERPEAQAPRTTDRRPRRYSDELRERELLVDRDDEGDEEPFDLAITPPELPASRSAMLASMTLAETGGLVGMWYRSVLGTDGYADENVTLGEVRHGRLPLRVRHPHTGNPVTIGEFRATETEAIANLDGPGEDSSRFDIGFGMAMGFNERKAIAMANMDLAAHRYRDSPSGDELEQLLLLATDGLAANGFLEHLKLPHYVTFQSSVDRALAARSENSTRQAEDAASELVEGEYA